MVDLELRHRLSQDLRRLVTGRMTNDDFDDAYYESYMDSNDIAVREISRFGWSLYSSDVLFCLPTNYGGRIASQVRHAKQQHMRFSSSKPKTNTVIQRILIRLGTR